MLKRIVSYLLRDARRRVRQIEVSVSLAEADVAKLIAKRRR